MAIDILSYTACKEVTYACTTGYNSILCTITSKLTCLTPNNAHETWRWTCHSGENLGYVDASNILCVVPTMSGTTGVSCTWTVPSGAKKARFELWGPGGPGGTSNCCGTGVPGSSGTYMEFTIPVTPGCQYTLYAAPSNPHCPYCCGCSSYYPACYCSLEATYVTGFGLSGVCAPGGFLDYYQNMCARLCRMGCVGSPTPCRFINECYFAASPNSCGISICYGVSLCNCGSQPTFYMHPVADWNVWPCGCITTGLCQFTPILRIPSIHSGQCIDTNNYGIWYIMPPIVTMSGLQNTGNGNCLNNILPSIMQYYVSSGSCVACAMSLGVAAYGCIPTPGLPGMGTHMMGGTTGYYGDRGRSGAVKVTWVGDGNTSLRCSN